MNEARAKYLIWDFDGTLAWRPGGWAGAVVAVLKRHNPGATVTPEQVSAYLQSGFPWHAPENPHPGLTPAEWWDDMQPVFLRALRSAGALNGKAEELAREVRPTYLDPSAWVRFEDAIPALERLSAHGWSHLLLSNQVPELPALLETLGLNGYFQAVFNSGDTGYEKPNPKAFRIVQDWTGTDATAWMVGDNFGVDILGALETGLPGILVRHPHPDAPIYCETLKEIVEKV